MAWVRKFLFHIGAIKSGDAVAADDMKILFLFHIGAIKRNFLIFVIISNQRVSIPHWCD